MNHNFIKNTLFVSFFFSVFVFFRDFLFALLIRFYDSWVSSFIILPSILLVILLIIKFYMHRSDFIYLKGTKIDFIFLFRIFLLCVCFYIYGQLLYYGLLKKYDLFNFAKSSEKISFFTFSSIILASLVEEIFFRGFLLHYAINFKVEKKTFNLVFFSILTSVFFSIAHMRFDLFFYQYFIFSLISSLIFIKSKNLFYPIVFHSFYNILAITNLGQVLNIKELNSINVVVLLPIFLSLIIHQMLKLNYGKTN